MLKKIVIAAIVGILGSGSGSVCAKVIKSPAYDFRKSGVLKVTEVERTKDATRLTFTAKFRPNWWIKLAPAEVVISLPDDTVKVKPLKLEGDLQYGEKYFMPESGEAVFTVTYPPLPKSVKKIDTGADTGWAIYGIDISGKKKKPNKGEYSVTPTPYRPIETIFASDTITVSGKVKNYDPRSGLKVLQLVIEDEAVGYTTPIAIPIKPDGSFSRRFFLPIAQNTYITNGDRVTFKVYLEPQNDLEILIDSDKLLELNATGAPIAEALTFGGSLAQINAEINACPVEPNNIYFTIDPKTAPEEGKRMIMAHHASKAAEFEAYIADKKVSPKAAQILRNNALIAKSIDLFSYLDFNDLGELLPEELYTDFINDALRADSTIIASGSYFLLNRLGFTRVLPSYRNDVNIPMLRQAIDFFTDNGIELTDDEKAKIHRIASFESPDSIQECTFSDIISLNTMLFEAARRGNKEREFIDREFFGQNGIFTAKKETDNEFIRRITGSGELPLVWQFAVTARDGRNNAEIFLPEITSKYEITNQYLIDRVTAAAEPKDGAWKLPDTEAGYFMKELIEPFRGKYLLVDFWDITCGPCRHGIESNKERRERHRGNPGFAFLFLASEKGSPLDRYNTYVEENLKGENVKRLPEDKMILLRELFEFNGIPRYILFNPDGEVMNSNYSTHEFWDLLKREGIIDESENN